MFCNFAMGVERTALLTNDISGESSEDTDTLAASIVIVPVEAILIDFTVDIDKIDVGKFVDKT